MLYENTERMPKKMRRGNSEEIFKTISAEFTDKSKPVHKEGVFDG